jgi:hypothetical protein
MALEELTKNGKITPTKLTKREYALGALAISWELTKYGGIPMTIGGYFGHMAGDTMLGVIIGGVIGCAIQDANNERGN